MAPAATHTDDAFDQTHWAPVRRREPLPTYYYHEHFQEMLSFVELNYPHVLSEEQRRLIDEFRALPEDARCLYVRLVNRKGRIFAPASLHYPELGSIQALLGRLRGAGFIRDPADADCRELLRFLNRSELDRLLAPRLTGMSRALKKAELVGLAEAHCPPAALLAAVAARQLFVQRYAEDMRYFLFLYFGRVQDGLTRFTMRDLGLVRTHDYRESYEPRYADREEALEHWYFADRLHRSRSRDTAVLDALVGESSEWPETRYPASAQTRDQLAHRLGREFEQSGDADTALALYRRGESAACSERVARLLLAAERRDEAQAFLEGLIDAPRSDDEAAMAEDLYARKFGGKRTSPLTDELREARTIELDESGYAAPEDAALAWHEVRGVQAYRAENGLWRTFFGLLFWDELFTGPHASLHSPFEFLPATLEDGRFLATQRGCIDKRLALLERPAQLKKELLRAGIEHYGKPNGVFRWRRSMLDALMVLIDRAPPAAMRIVLEKLCGDYRNSRHGYPDLMLVEQGELRFAEIKTDGDALRRNQLVRLQQLRAAGFHAEVVRVRWVLDPRQTYAVVDVETTGGPDERHRVTEIGAIKVQGGAIVDRFETLLNPGRPIPPEITRLTGITPAMVADAPPFADVADRLATFLDGSIFVAHNVDFDYGFLSREFGRLGRPFRYPKLCTCASMRRLYPGQRSYSLASLCAAFGIELRRHHRAMADAEAAAELLCLVNEKRAAAASPKPPGNCETESIAAVTFRT
jgi:DNA polymerase-3 subunit epsilon